VINFKSIPFFKILFPYIFGIICAFKIGTFSQMHIAFLFAFLFLCITFLVQRFYKSHNKLKKTVYIIAINVFLFTLAFETSYLYNDKNKPNHYSHFVTNSKQSFFVTVDDIPLLTEKYTKLLVNLNSIETNNKWHAVFGKTIIYLKTDSDLKLSIGSSLFLNSKISDINSPKNPEEFDYKDFLESRNIFHTVFADRQDVQLISLKNKFQVSQIGTVLKSHLVSALRDSQLSKEAFSICSALLVGYDDEIDSDTMQSFSHSGTLHILSVSGMHTGVLYVVLIYVFSLFDKYDKRKKLKFVFVMTFLWLFVLITGLSPSILRAAIMLSLVLFGTTFYKQGNSYNTLLLSSFILLVYNPYLIKDVGFLLSYSAVFGIMYLYPKFQKTYTFENKILQNTWAGVLMSVAATIFTLPISLYFFHQFPTWFVFSNMVIIPISFVIMGAAALFLISYKIVIINHFLVFIINGATSLMLWIAHLTDNSKYGYIDFISFTKIDFVFLSVLIVLGLIILSQKQYKYLVTFGIVVITWTSLSILSYFQQTQNKEFIVFHVKQKSVYALRLGNRVYIHLDDINQKDFQRFVKPYLITIASLKTINIKTDIIKYDDSITFYHHINANQSTMNSNYIIVSNDMPLKLTTNYKTKPVVVADCSNSFKFVRKLKKQCALLDVPFYSVKEKGAFHINL